MTRSALPRSLVERYSRQLLLPEFAEAQARLARARVLLVGVGGLGTPIATYLTGAGVGHLTLCDDDVVSLSNLQRQTLYTTPDVGRAKTEVAAARLQQLNPNVSLARHGHVDARSLASLVAAHDLVIDASDNFQTRYLVSDTCCAQRRRWVWGAAGAFEGMASVLGPICSLRDLFPASDAASGPDQAEPAEDCDTIGVFGPLLGVVGSVMAAEALKLLGELGSSLDGQLWIYDALAARTHTVTLPRRPTPDVHTP